MSWKFWEREEEQPEKKKEPEQEYKPYTPKKLTPEFLRELAIKRAQGIKTKAEQVGLPPEVIELQEEVENLQSQQCRTRESIQKQEQEISRIKQDIKSLRQQVTQLEADQRNTERVLENLADALNELLSRERPEASKAAQDVIDQLNKLWEAIRELEAKVDSLSK